MVHAGEILHGKTSNIRHDSKGIYVDLPQNLPVTRYHSLAGTHPSLPRCLEVSSWVARENDGEKGIIMGVRHKEFVVEGVQFHPESILTDRGRSMLKNFLKMRGGTWQSNERLCKEAELQRANGGLSNGSNAQKSVEANANKSESKQSILDQIYDHRKAAVATQKQIPSQRPLDFQAAYHLDLAPPLISFVDRLKQSPYSLALMAEIKRASPSKGIISKSTCAPEQARIYALAGASVISVLTEPHWFKGSIEDLRQVRQALSGMSNRPAVLRKEFIFDEYQILEARLAGADTVLLIVKMLDGSTLKQLYDYSISLGMEPLVEVNTADEMKIAIELGAKVIGVNNRNLTSFEVDLGTTSRLMDLVPQETVVCALSGISGPHDVQAYKKSGVGAVLVGEALMRATNTTAFVKSLLGDPTAPVLQDTSSDLIVKICGTRSAEAAKVAIDAGADLIGMILAQGRKRTVDNATALQISKAVRTCHRSYEPRLSPPTSESTKAAADYFQYTFDNHLLHPSRALLVGVFQGQPLSYILAQQKLLDLDIVQLHGSEPLEWASLIPVPVIRSFKPGDAGLGQRGYHAFPLLDAAHGGSGQRLKLDEVGRSLEKDRGLRVILAGGLAAENVGLTVRELGEAGKQVLAVDVSSGVEENGAQSIERIRSFVQAAKSARRSS